MVVNLILCNHGSLHIPVYTGLSHLIRNNSVPSLMLLHIQISSSSSPFHHLFFTFLYFSTLSLLLLFQFHTHCLIFFPSFSCPRFHTKRPLPCWIPICTVTTLKAKKQHPCFFTAPRGRRRTTLTETAASTFHEPPGRLLGSSPCGEGEGRWTGWRFPAPVSLYCCRAQYSYQERRGRHCGRWLF